MINLFKARKGDFFLDTPWKSVTILGSRGFFLRKRASWRGPVLRDIGTGDDIPCGQSRIRVRIQICEPVCPRIARVRLVIGYLNVPHRGTVIIRAGAILGLWKRETHAHHSLPRRSGVALSLSKGEVGWGLTALNRPTPSNTLSVFR